MFKSVKINEPVLIRADLCKLLVRFSVVNRENRSNRVVKFFDGVGRGETEWGLTQVLALPVVI